MLLAPLVAGTIGCHDPTSAPAASRTFTENQPQRDVIYDRYPTTEEYLASGGVLQPTVTSQPNPNAEFVLDHNGRYALKVSAKITYQFVNEVDASLRADITSTNGGNVLFSQSQPYRSYFVLPVLIPRSVALGFTLAAGTHRCGIKGRAHLLGNGTLRLLDSKLLPFTLYSLTLSQVSGEPTLPDCEQRRTTEEATGQSCGDQTAFAPPDCSGGSSSPAVDGGAGGCALWVRRVWVTYDGGATWQLESESFFTRC